MRLKTGEKEKEVVVKGLFKMTRLKGGVTEVAAKRSETREEERRMRWVEINYTSGSTGTHSQRIREKRSWNRRRRGETR